jgi:CheY-like chemotaxis protein
MSMTILVVTPDAEFISGLTTMLSPHAAILHLHPVNNRKEALAALEKASFQQIVTSLKIPGVSDGYRFLSQIGNKVVEGKNIIVLVDKKTDGVRPGITFFGLEHIYTVDDLAGIVQVILQNSRLATPEVKNLGSSPETSADEERIRSALSQVMGPVGSLIYQNALKLWTNNDDTGELARIIAAEIGEEEQINQFYQLLR